MPTGTDYPWPANSISRSIAWPRAQRYKLQAVDEQRVSNGRDVVPPLDERRACIFMPCYRTARFLEAPIARIPWKELPPLQYRLLCVDNASPDDTWEVIQGAVGTLREQGHDADAIRNPRNLSYGGSVKVAFRYWVANNFGLMVVLHSDGQYAPELLPWLISELVASDDTMLFGSRLAGDALAGGMPAYKYYANHVLTWLQNAALGTRFSELHSGLRLYRVNRVVRLPYEANTDFSWRTSHSDLLWGGEILRQSLSHADRAGDQRARIRGPQSWTGENPPLRHRSEAARPRAARSICSAVVLGDGSRPDE